jgi:hypothetical protein
VLKEFVITMADVAKYIYILTIGNYKLIKESFKKENEENENCINIAESEFFDKY